MSVMNAHPPIVLEPSTETPRRDAHLHGRSSASERPTVGEVLDEFLPLIFFVPVAGPPAILLLGPLLLFVLVLIAPAAFLITLVVVLVLGAGILVALGALIASPYLLVRHLRARHAAASPAPAVSEVAGARVGRPAEQSIPRLIDLTTR